MNASFAEVVARLRSTDHTPREEWDRHLAATTTAHQAWQIVSLSNAPLDFVRDWLVTPDARIVTEAMLRLLLNGWATRDAQHDSTGFMSRAALFAWYLTEVRLQDLRPMPRWADLLPEVLDDPRALNTLAAHTDPRLRRRIAFNDHTPPHTLAALMSDGDSLTRRNASWEFSRRLSAAV